MKNLSCKGHAVSSSTNRTPPTERDGNCSTQPLSHHVTIASFDSLVAAQAKDVLHPRTWLARVARSSFRDDGLQGRVLVLVLVLFLVVLRPGGHDQGVPRVLFFRRAPGFVGGFLFAVVGVSVGGGGRGDGGAERCVLGFKTLVDPLQDIVQETVLVQPLLAGGVAAPDQHRVGIVVLPAVAMPAEFLYRV